MDLGVGREECSKPWPLPVPPGLLLPVLSPTCRRIVSRSSGNVNSFSSEITEPVVSDKNTLGGNLGLGETDTDLPPPACPQDVTSRDKSVGHGVTHPSVTAGLALCPCHPPCPSRDPQRHSSGSVGSSPRPNTTASHCSHPKSGSSSKHQWASDCCMPLVDFQNTEGAALSVLSSFRVVLFWKENPVISSLGHSQKGHFFCLLLILYSFSYDFYCEIFQSPRIRENIMNIYVLNPQLKK